MHGQVAYMLACCARAGFLLHGGVEKGDGCNREGLSLNTSIPSDGLYVLLEQSSRFRVFVLTPKFAALCHAQKCLLSWTQAPLRASESNTSPSTVAPLPSTKVEKSTHIYCTMIGRELRTSL